MLFSSFPFSLLHIFSALFLISSCLLLPDLSARCFSSQPLVKSASWYPLPLCSHFTQRNRLNHITPKAHLACGTVLSLLLTLLPMPAQYGGPAAPWWRASPLVTHVGAQLGIRAGGARTTFPAQMWISRVGVGTRGKRDSALLLTQAPRWK